MAVSNFKDIVPLSAHDIKNFTSLIMRLNNIVVYQSMICKTQHKKFSTTTKLSSLARMELGAMKYYFDKCPNGFIEMFQSDICDLFNNRRIYNVYRVIEACSYYLYLDGVETLNIDSII